MSRPVKVGIIGCGKIFPVYVDGLRRLPNRVEVAWCTDIIPERASEGAERFGIPHHGWNDEMFADPEVEVAINLTPPVVHAEVITDALQAGKHVYTEKPLAVNVADARKLLGAVAAAGRLLCSATDTYLGPAGQTARASIDRGDIGEPLGFTMFGGYSKAETWHPDPTFLFQVGGGPLLDSGPYFVSELVSLLGPVEAVTGRTRYGAPQRQVSAPNRLVEVIDVEVPTHASALIELESGVAGTYVSSFDVWNNHNQPIEIYGSLGTLSVPHPNWFRGDVYLQLLRDSERRLLEPVLPPVEGEGPGGVMLRGYGVMDLLDAIATGEDARTAGSRAYHVLEVLEGIQRSTDERRRLPVESTCERPSPVAAEVFARWS